MKRYSAFLWTLTLVSMFQGGYTQQHLQRVPSPTGLQWETNYDTAVQRAKEKKVPLILFFTGSDWCGWCTRLEEEVLNTNDFMAAAQDHFVFLKVDFPRSKSQDSQTKEQNQTLKSRFNIRSYPTLVLFDPVQQRQIGVTGYRPGGPKPFADHLMRMVGDFHTYLHGIDQLNQNTLSGNDLKQLYEKAGELDFESDLSKIVKAGVDSNEKFFFQLEQYRLFAQEGTLYSQEALSLRKQLLDQDPKNEQKIHYEVAIIDFEAISEDNDREAMNPEKVVAPLVSYIKNYGTQDKENLWRLQMIISQVYLDKNKMGQALQYAKSCYETAPSSVQKELETAIKNIQVSLATTQ